MRKKHYKPEKKQESFRETLARAAEEMEIQAGPVLDLPAVECSTRSVLVERHHGILEYTKESIRIAARELTLRVTGMGLEIVAMTAEELEIRGDIASVEFIRQGAEKCC
ncbi:YabP/YqfC family sporulation protein [Acidaminobacterium chupaoyuni]